MWKLNNQNLYWSLTITGMKHFSKESVPNLKHCTAKMSLHCIDKHLKANASWLWSPSAVLLNRNTGQNLGPMGGEEASLIDLGGIMA